MDQDGWLQLVPKLLKLHFLPTSHVLASVTIPQATNYKEKIYLSHNFGSLKCKIRWPHWSGTRQQTVMAELAQRKRHNGDPGSKEAEPSSGSDNNLLV